MLQNIYILNSVLLNFMLIQINPEKIIYTILGNTTIFKYSIYTILPKVLCHPLLMNSFDYSNFQEYKS